MLPTRLSRKGTWRNYTAADELPHNHVRCAGEDREGHLWFGIASDVVRCAGRAFQIIRFGRDHSDT